MKNSSIIVILLTQYILPTLVFTIGLTLNLIGFLFLLRKKTNSPTRLMHLVLLSNDTLILISLLLITHLGAGYDIYFELLSNTSCKFYAFFAYVFISIPYFILIYINLEVYLAYKYHHRSNIMRKQKSQLLALLVIITFNCVFYSPTVFYYSKHPNTIRLILNKLNVSHCYPKNMIQYQQTNCSNLVLYTPFFDEEEIFSLKFHQNLLKSINDGVFTFYAKTDQIDDIEERYVKEDYETKYLFARFKSEYEYCSLNEENLKTIFKLILIPKVLLPLGLILVCISTCYGNIIARSLNRRSNYRHMKEIILNKDINVSLFSLCHNLLFVCTNLPLQIVQYHTRNIRNNLYYLIFYSYFLIHSFNFLFLIIFNRDLRVQFCSFLTRKNINRNELNQPSLILNETFEMNSTVNDQSLNSKHLYQNGKSLSKINKRHLKHNGTTDVKVFKLVKFDNLTNETIINSENAFYYIKELQVPIVEEEF